MLVCRKNPQLYNLADWNEYYENFEEAELAVKHFKHMDKIDEQRLYSRIRTVIRK